MRRILCLCALLLSFPALALNPLPADQAFKLTTKILDPNTVQLTFDIENGYYLYRDRLNIQTSDALNLGPVRYPKVWIKHDTSGKPYPVYRTNLQLPLALLADKKGEEKLTINYQGCSDDGFCYPPISQSFILKIDKDAAIVGIKTAKKEKLVSKKLLAPYQGVFKGHHLLFILLSFYGLGLLLAFTPCVLPMVPVLSGIIIGHGHKISTKKAFLLSLSYVLAMAITYAAAGILVATVGANIQVALQAPIVLSLFSGLFVLLALSMFGFFEIKLPESWQARIAKSSNKNQKSGYLGAAFMGALSTLILSPCVSAPLVGVLSYIASSGDMFLGGTTLFLLGLGMGTPLLLIGTTAGKLLPKTGVWMNAVKAFFGVLLLAVAIYLLSRIIPPFVSLSLWATLLIVSSMFLHPFQNTRERSAAQIFWQGIGLILLFYGVILLVGAALGGKSALSPLQFKQAHIIGPNKEAAPYELINNKQALKKALKKHKGQLVLLDFYADWCASCQVMESQVFDDIAVQKLMKNMVWLKADVTAQSKDEQDLSKAYNVIAPPVFIFFDKNGKEIKNMMLIGEQSKAEFLTHLQKLRKNL